MTKITSKLCPKCDTVKPISQFRKSKKYKSGYRSWCNRCESKCSMKYYDKHRKTIKEFRRKHLIQSSDKGKRVWINKVVKRDYPNKNECEICNKTAKRLSYHHWNDNNPSLGIWMCHSCHSGCNFIEKTKLLKTYLLMKINITKNFNPDTSSAPNGIAEFLSLKN